LLFAAILVLPQVALPALAFHNGNAPVAAHSRVCNAAPGAAISIAAHVPPPAPMKWIQAESPKISMLRAVDPSLSKLCVLIC
jgi:hypothetical protein